MCRDCNTTVFSRRDFEEELSKKAPDQKSYEILIEYERGIKLSLTNFQRSLLSLQDPDKPPSHVQLAEASRVRKRLIDSFGKYDILAKRIRDLPTSSPTQMKLQKSIYQQASSFLHLYMLPLKSLPKVLKHASPHGINGQNGSSRHGDTLAAIKFNDVDSASQISSSSALSAMEAEEKQLRERLIVLEEQKFFVSEMMADANKRRRFDEVSSLSTNMDDLKGEIDQVNSTLAQLDFAGVYGQMGYIKQ
jgi:rabenosyn-5